MARGKHNPFWIVLDAHGVLIPSSERGILRNLARHAHVFFPTLLARWFFYHPAVQQGKMDSKTYYEKVTGRPLTQHAYKQWILDQYAKKMRIHPSVLRELKRLKKNGWKLGVLSNMHEHQARMHREQKTFKDFDMVLFSCDLGNMKPFPAAFDAMRKHTRTRSDRIVFIDDMWVNVVPAQLLGFNAVRIKGEAPLARFLRELD